MNPQTIRRLDFWIGQPGCFALTLWRRLMDAFRGHEDFSRPPRKVLFLKLIEQGATVLAYAAIKRAVDMVGRDNVYFLVFEENRAVLDLLELIPPENVLTVRHSGLFTFAKDTLGALKRIRAAGIDASVDMEFFSRASAMLGYLSGARRRVGLHRFNTEAPYRGDLMSYRIQYNPYLHVAASYYMLVEALRCDPRELPMPKTPVPAFDAAPPMYEPRAGEVERVQAALDREAGRPVGRPIVLLNPNAGDMLPLRRWPTERFVELGKRLLAERPDVTIAITGAPSEREPAEAVARQVGPPDRVVCMAGRTSLRELFTLYTMADALVTNDSGPGHFASMSKIPSLVLFGPETPALFGPLGPGSQTLTAGLGCSPCVNAMNHRFSPCKNNVCMQLITVDEVYARVVGMLEGRVPLPVLAGAAS